MYYFSDEDATGVNKLTYNIEGGASSLITLNPYTGELNAALSAQGRSGQQFSIRVRVTDNGFPRRHSFTVVDVYVIRANNNAPVFVSGQIFSASANEDASIGHVVGIVSASDRDGGQIRYFIINGNDDGLFEMDNVQGRILVTGMLDYEESSQHTIIVMARDQHSIPREVSHEYVINVNDVNDNPPLFASDVFDVNMAENTAIDTSVFLLETSDKDISHTVNYAITHTKPNQANNKFSVDSRTGLISSQQDLDYESERLYELEVKAFNPGSTLSSLATVRVHITSVNEFIPQCSEERYNFAVSESAALGYVLGSVSATDIDEGIHGQPLFYFVGNGNDRGFSIESTTGIITMAGRVNRESYPSVELDVLVKNLGPATCNNTAICHVSVSVNDANDPPVFTEKLYSAVVSEDVDRGEPIITVQAQDMDAQPQYQRFIYRILDPRAIDIFTVGERSGVVSVSNIRLDREKKEVHVFIVSAVDSGSPPQTGQCCTVIC